MSFINLPYQPRRDDPLAAMTVQKNLDYLAQLFEKGDINGAILRWSSASDRYVAGSAPVGTALPSSPADGEEFDLVDSLTSPTYRWRFRYNAGSSHSDKWEFVGGSSLYDEETTSATISSGSTYADYNSGQPQVTVPRGGLYEIHFGAEFQVASATADGARVGLSIGGATPTDALSVSFSDPDPATAVASTSASRKLRATAAATNVIKLQAKSTNGVTDHSQRFISVLPVRVS